LYDNDRPPVGGRVKRVLLGTAIATAFALGVYSLILASVNADKVQPLAISGLVRTATASDMDRIATALGNHSTHELVYVVMDTPELGPDPNVEIAAKAAAQILTDSGLVVSVRVLGPGDLDFAAIVEQNGIGRFPAVLVVKKEGGIVLVSDDLSEKNLLHAYFKVFGKKSSCDGAASEIY
jgi:hypothetical protein